MLTDDTIDELIAGNSSNGNGRNKENRARGNLAAVEEENISDILQELSLASLDSGIDDGDWSLPDHYLMAGDRAPVGSSSSNKNDTLAILDDSILGEFSGDKGDDDECSLDRVIDRVRAQRTLIDKHTQLVHPHFNLIFS